MTRPRTQLRPLGVLVPLILSASAVWAVGDASADDTGDAPDSYGVAVHTIVEGAPYLGRTSPDENEQAASVGADADDIASGDDEDGVFAFPKLVQNFKAYNTNVFASNPGAVDAALIGWVDFDGNGIFDDDEVARDTVPAGTRNAKFKLAWPDLSGVTTDYVGDTYARFRISTVGAALIGATGALPDGEVEDYILQVQSDVDGDEIPDAIDPDNDNDGIPDEIETVGVDSDADGTPDYLDGDADGDGIADFVEAGPDPSEPLDTDGDGVPDYLDLDSNNDGMPDADGIAGDTDGDGIPDKIEGADDADSDGIANLDDLDSDNDSIPDAIEVGRDAADSEVSAPVDSDLDGVPDMFDLDSDNDGIPDLWEANSGELDIRPLDADRDGRIDNANSVGPNGLADAIETDAESGVPVFAAADTDGDRTSDYLDIDSDADSITDVAESGRPDADVNGRVDEFIDTTGDGQPDGPDTDGDGMIDGSNAIAGGELPDTNGNGIPAFQDPDEDGSAGGSDGGTTEGGATDGTTTGATIDAARDDDPQIETGLSGGAGCSIARSGNAPDPLFALFALGAAGMLARRRASRCQVATRVAG